MSHLTDGEIHVHLDGALDLLPDHRAAEIRKHLSRCEDCQARLEEERRIRDHASEILGGAAAGAAAIEPPSFESIRERAGGGASTMPSAGPGPVGREADSGEGDEAAGHESTRTGGSSAPSRESWYRRLAWAASIVLSLGIGWYARTGVVETDIRSRPTLTAPSSPADEAAASSQPPTPAATELARTAESTSRDGETERREAAQQVSAEAAPPTEAPAVAPTAGARYDARALTDADGAVPVDGSLAVPGLTVVSVAWEDADDGGQVVTVVQRLPSGDPLTLRFTALTSTTADLDDGRGPSPDAVDAAAADRIAAAEAPDQSAEDLESLEQARANAEPVGPGPVTLRHGPWHLEATAPIRSDSVRALLSRLPPLP